jgi:hypothetical protein
VRPMIAAPKRPRPIIGSSAFALASAVCTPPLSGVAFASPPPAPHLPLFAPLPAGMRC